MEIALRSRRLQAVAAQFLLGTAGLALITFVCLQLGFGLGRTAFAYVILLALVSLLGSFSVSVVLSVIAAACLDYFFAPPLFTFGANVSDDIARIAAFLTTSLVVTALTARLKRRGQELGESKASLEATQRIAHVGWWERDLSSGDLTLSDEVCRIFGVQPVDLLHTRWLDLLHPEDRARVAEAAAAALVRGGPRYDVEYRVARSDGSVRAVRSQGDVTWDDAGRPLRQFGVLQDITELRQAEEEVRASEARFRTFADHATDAFFLLDDHSTILDVNRQACESLGYRREELIGKHRREFDAGLDEVSVASLKQRIAAGSGSRSRPSQAQGRHHLPGGVSRRAVRPADVGSCPARHHRAQAGRGAARERGASHVVDYAIDGFFRLTSIRSFSTSIVRLRELAKETIGQHKGSIFPCLDQVSIARLACARLTGETVTFESHHRRKEIPRGSSRPRVRARWTAVFGVGARHHRAQAGGERAARQRGALSHPRPILLRPVLLGNRRTASLHSL
jgi:PAS domain S-box-containing protein